MVYFDEMLYKRYLRKYKLNAVLHNNAILSYSLLPSSSLSLDERIDVQLFRSFIQKNLKTGRILDVGCGPLPLPGYLSIDMIDDSELYGIDIIENENFHGIFTQCFMENMPYPNDFFNTIICATSLDHCIDLNAAINEIVRVMNKDGFCFIWNGIVPFKTKLVSLFKSKMNPYIDYGEGIIFYIPKGAIDPFHKKYLSSKEIIKKFAWNGCVLIQEEIIGANTFLSFQKT